MSNFPQPPTNSFVSSKCPDPCELWQYAGKNDQQDLHWIANHICPPSIGLCLCSLLFRLLLIFCSHLLPDEPRTILRVQEIESIFPWATRKRTPRETSVYRKLDFKPITHAVKHSRFFLMDVTCRKGVKLFCNKTFWCTTDLQHEYPEPSDSSGVWFSVAYFKATAPSVNWISLKWQKRLHQYRKSDWGSNTKTPVQLGFPWSPIQSSPPSFQSSSGASPVVPSQQNLATKINQVRRWAKARQST